MIDNLKNKTIEAALEVIADKLGPRTATFYRPFYEKIETKNILLSLNELMTEMYGISESVKILTRVRKKIKV